MTRRRGDHARHELLPGGTRVYLRLVREADLVHAAAYFAGLSPESRYMRFMGTMRELAPDTLAQLKRQLEEPRAAIIAAVVDHPAGEEIVGGVRIVPGRRPHRCEFALSVVDCWQGRGVGRVLLREGIRAARRLGYRSIDGSVLAANAKMLGLAQRARMHLRVATGVRGTITVWRDLRPLRSRAAGAKP